MFSLLKQEEPLKNKFNKSKTMRHHKEELKQNIFQNSADSAFPQCNDLNVGLFYTV